MTVSARPNGSGFSVYNPDCPARLVLEHVTSRWGVLVLSVLLSGTRRFGELRRHLGVSEKVLAQTLQALERDGLVRREVYPEVPPRVDYSLTALGREAAALTGELVMFIEDRMPQIIDQQRHHDAGIDSSPEV